MLGYSERNRYSLLTDANHFPKKKKISEPIPKLCWLKLLSESLRIDQIMKQGMHQPFVWTHNSHACSLITQEDKGK